MKFRKTASSVLAVAMSVAFIASVYVPYIENQSLVSYASEGINVAEHTPEEIKQYIDAHPFDMQAQPVYTVQPSTTAPYEIGELDNATKENALNALNCMRYIAGLPEVTLNEEYGRLAQAAAFVNSVNGSSSHYPQQPAGVPDDIYQLGRTGASESNLCSGDLQKLAKAILVYMNDSDSKNISRVGHRRWCLNPTMATTGFGVIGNMSAMYVLDSNRRKTESNVCWPAQNMPIEYFSTMKTYQNLPAWSISLNKNLFKDYVEVNLVRTSDMKEWNFSTLSADGDFYVDNGYYAEPGCIIFRPSDISYNDGDKFDVKITTEDSTIEYSVNFFSLSSVKKNEAVKTSIGNVNGDYYIDSVDASIVLDEYANYSTGRTSILNDEQKKCADVNKDGLIDANDATKILEYYSYISTNDNPLSMENWL